jgi:hypothetical protein
MPDQKPFSEVVREYGVQQGEYAMARADEWRTWAEQLDELIRDIPQQTNPWVYEEDGDRSMVPMGANHVDPAKLRKRLYRVVAEADAYAAALIRAAVLAENGSTELAHRLAVDECSGCGRPPYQCDWDRRSAEKCCEECSHIESGEDGEPRG